MRKRPPLAGRHIAQLLVTCGALTTLKPGAQKAIPTRLESRWA